MTVTKSLSEPKSFRACVRAGSGGSLLKLHEDVQTCGYQDVQVMFDMLTSELEAAHARKQPPSPPLAWSEPSSSSSMAGVQ